MYVTNFGWIWLKNWETATSYAISWTKNENEHHVTHVVLPLHYFSLYSGGKRDEAQIQTDDRFQVISHTHCVVSSFFIQKKLGQIDLTYDQKPLNSSFVVEQKNKRWEPVRGCWENIFTDLHAETLLRRTQGVHRRSEGNGQNVDSLMRAALLERTMVRGVGAAGSKPRIQRRFGARVGRWVNRWAVLLIRHREPILELWS